MTTPDEDRTLHGLMSALGAFVIWGLSPIFFKLLTAVDPIEVVAYRIVWTVVLLGMLFHLWRLWPKVRAEIKGLSKIIAYSITTTLIAVNWGVFIWAINEERIVEVSLGYYINPLVVVFLAMVVLGERLRRLQAAAVGLAVLGVGYSVWQAGSVPMVTIALALSFSTYAVIRKKEGMDPFIGLFVETLMILPVALIYIGFMEATTGGALAQQGWTIHLLLAAGGVVTAVPLICYMEGAKYLPLKTMGLLGYLAPSLQLAIGVMLYNEPFTTDTQITFALIWMALMIYSFDAFKARRQVVPG